MDALAKFEKSVRRLAAADFTGDIQRGIPVPPKQNGPVSKYRAKLKRLAIGESFFVEPGRGVTPHLYAKEYGIKITTRRIGNGVRVWRIA